LSKDKRFSLYLIYTNTMNYTAIEPYLASKKTIPDAIFKTFAMDNDLSTESIRPKDVEIQQLKAAFPELGVKIYSFASKWTPRHLSSPSGFSIGEYEVRIDLFAPSTKYSYAIIPLSNSTLSDVHIHVKPDTFKLFGITMGNERPQGKNLLAFDPEFDTYYAVYAPAEHEDETRQLVTSQVQAELLRTRKLLPFKHDHLKFISTTIHNGSIYLLYRGARLNNPFLLKSMTSLAQTLQEPERSIV
jgi:hypothetical protein